MIELEQKVDTLKETLEDFIKYTGIEFNKAYNLHMESQLEFNRFKEEMKEFKDEMKEFKDEMKEFKEEMKFFKEESRTENREMNKRWGELSNKMGTLVEDLVYPSLPRLIDETHGLAVSDLMIRRRKKLKDGRNREFDAIAVAENYIFLNSTKSTMRINYIDEFITEINEFRDFFPEYREYRIIGILASLSIDDSMKNYAEKKGFYVTAVGDTLMDIRNTPGFKPVEW